MYLVLEKILGLLMIGLGGFVIYNAYTKPIKFLKALNFRAYVFGFFFVIIGFAVVIGKCHFLHALIRRLSGNG